MPEDLLPPARERRLRYGLRSAVTSRTPRTSIFEPASRRQGSSSPTPRRRPSPASLFLSKSTGYERFQLTLCHRIFYIPKVRLSKVGDRSALRLREGFIQHPGLRGAG
jgi:hypothetical protein